MSETAPRCPGCTVCVGDFRACDPEARNENRAPLCALCGEPMPPGEEMFRYHGYSGDCPKPPKERDV